MQMPMKRKIILSTIAVGVGLFAVFMAAQRSLRKPIPQLDKSPKTALPEDLDKFQLKTFAVQTDVLVHLLDGDFYIVRQMKDIPSSCATVFESSFMTHSGSHANPGEIRFANPGEAFQASDNIVNPGLPFRRLEFAGLGATKCFIHYHRGGGQPAAFCLAVMDYANQKTVFVGEAPRAAKNLDELRRMILGRQFEDIAWLAVC